MEKTLIGKNMIGYNVGKKMKESFVVEKTALLKNGTIQAKGRNKEGDNISVFVSPKTLI